MKNTVSASRFPSARSLQRLDEPRCAKRRRVRPFLMKEEIKSHHWKELCDRLSDFERGQLVTIDTVEHDGTQRRLGDALVLESIDLTVVDGCNDGIILRAADGFEHTIIQPLHVRLLRNGNGGFNPVEIDAEAGSAILHFKPALKPTILQGLGLVGWSSVRREPQPK